MRRERILQERKSKEEQQLNKKHRNPMLGKAIKDLDLSVRARNSLLDSCIFTIGELVETPTKELLKIRSLGKATLEELENMLAQYDLEILDSREYKASKRRRD